MKAMIVVDIPNIIESCAIDELGFVADLHIQPTTLCSYDPFDLKDVDVRPLPQKKEVEVNEIEDIMRLEYSIEDIYTGKHIANIRLAMDKLISLGWNACLDDITGEIE